MGRPVGDASKGLAAATAATTSVRMGGLFFFDEHTGPGKRRHQLCSCRRFVVDVRIQACRTIEKRHIVDAGNCFQGRAGPFHCFGADGS